MALNPPRLPVAARAINFAGGVVRAAGIDLANLDADALVATAEEHTGLGDFGGETWREPLALLCDSLENEADLTLLGRMTARNDVLRLLEHRLRVTDTLKRNPEILDRPIERPLFVLGLPRTGTSILHMLLAQDPANRVPMSWEVMHPWPAPERETFATDPRIALVDKHFAQIDSVLPDFKRMHPMGALLPQECVVITAFEFVTLVNHTGNRVPSYQKWMDTADLRPAYRFHKRMLQFLQWRCPAERWVLKSPGHLWALDALLDVYPDARFVQTHRDPLTVVASLTSLVTVLRSLGAHRVDPGEIGMDWTQRLAEGLERSMRERDARVPDDRVMDIQFEDFMADEIGTVRRIYERFDMPFSDVAASRMHRFLAGNPRDKHGGHRYTLADTGLQLDIERRRYAAYQQRFGVPCEPLAGA